jgi:hypothetical protein
LTSTVPLFLGFDGDFMDADESCACLFGDGEGIAQMVAVVVSDDDQISILDLRGRGRSGWISGEERVDIDRFRALDLDGGMAEPGNIHAFPPVLLNALTVEFSR